MKRLALWAALLGGAVVAWPAGAAPPLAAPAELMRVLGPITTELRAAQTLRGRYTQRKHLPELPKPVVADGDFLFVRGRGIVWRTVKPFASELIITADALIQRENGNALRIGAERQPAIRLVAQIFFAVFSLDLDALDKLFQLDGSRAQKKGERWRLGLRPRHSIGTLKEIEVRGRAQVERVVLREHNGDLTEIELHDTRASSAAPSAADLALFTR